MLDISRKMCFNNGYNSDEGKKYAMKCGKESLWLVETGTRHGRNTFRSGFPEQEKVGEDGFDRYIERV